jgi:Sulfotransferase family
VPAEAGGGEPTIVHLASSPYSGSTLVSYLLGIHPEIATVSDVSGRRREARMATFACSCGRLMRDDPFWLRVADEMRAAGEPEFDLGNFRLGFDEGRGRVANRIAVGSLRWSALERARDVIVRRWPGEDRSMREIGGRNLRFATVVTRVLGAHVFVDASKERLRARYLRRYVDPDTRVVHLVRDVRGVVASARGHATHAGASAEALARDWARTNDTIARLAAEAGPGKHMLVRYEDLCREPERVLADLYAFCGADPAASARNDEQHLLGNRIRMGSLDEIRLDERWRTVLSPAEQSAVLAVAGDVHRRLGGQD